MKTGEVLFNLRGYIPVPFGIAMICMPWRWSLWRPSLGDPRGPAAVIGAGFLLVAAGECLRLAAAAHASPAVRSRVMKVSELFTTGPYAHVRNPLYLGNFIILMGMLVMSWAGFPWYFLLCAVIFWWEYHQIIKAEESVLARTFGDSYRAYRECVPRIIPSFRARWTSHGAKVSSYGKAFKIESRSLRAEAFVMLLIALRWYIVLKAGTEG